MATRSSGVSGAIYGLVIFVFLFVIALALAIMFYAQRTDAQKQLGDKTKELAAFLGSQESDSAAYGAVKQAVEGKDRTIFGQLNLDNETLKRWLAGAGKPISQLESEIKEAGITDGNNAVSVIAKLQGELAAGQEALAKMQKDLEDRVAQVKRLNEQFEQAQSGIAGERSTLTTQLSTRTDQFDKTSKDYDAAHKDLLAQMDKTRADAQAQVAQMQDKVNDMQSTVDKLNARIRELVNIISRSRIGPPDATLEADGQIIDVVPTDSMVYINLGRDDHLILGMTFEVFDEGTGIRTEVERNGTVVQVGGKAKIEVVRFGDSGKTAACRVIHVAYGKPIVAGDLISNIVYDRNRVFRFYVFGDFDLEHNGQSTAADRERINSLITKWGGQIITSDQMPVDTDFLILGMEPALPQALPDNPVPTPEQMQEHLTAMQKYKQYYELAGQARELSIPILNQNRFLTLIGYYSR